jgi:hemerythrin-like metal-binding protein
MALMTWNDSLSVGVQSLDAQHSVLVETLNDLHAAMMKGQGKSLTAPLLHNLLTYTRSHFSAEEAMMASANYPGLGQHRIRHRDLTRQVEEFITRYEQGEITLNMHLLTFLRDWLTTHILKEDREYGPWLNQHGAR